MSFPLRLVVLLLVYAAFVSMGLPDGILGAAWPQMRAELRVGLNDNWLMLVLGTCGASISSFASGMVLRRLGIARVLTLTTFLTAIVIWGYALSPSFALVSGLAFFLGLGNGAIDAGLNHFVATTLTSSHMNWLHASWGVGVSCGTLIVSTAFASGATWRTAYMTVGTLQFLLALVFVLQARSFPNTVPRTENTTTDDVPTFRSTLTLGNAWVAIVAFFVYTGLESSTGLWIASLLHDGRAWSLEAVALVTTLYWASLTVGRFLTGFISERLSAMRLLRLAVVGAIVGTSLIALSSFGTGLDVAKGVVTALGVLLTGLSLSPVYPTLMHDTPRAVGADHSVNLIGFQGGAGQLGFTIVPIAVGTVLQAYSTRWLGVMLTTLAVTLLTLLVVRERIATRRTN